MSDRMTCDNPDHDNAKLVCGYPLPCPWHTAEIHPDKEPPTVEIPITAHRALRSRQLLADVAEVLSASKEQA
jgi:hypothetical protein